MQKNLLSGLDHAGAAGFHVGLGGFQVWHRQSNQVHPFAADFLEQRRILLARWADYVTGIDTGLA